MTIRNRFALAAILLVAVTVQPAMAADQRSRGGREESRGGEREESRGRERAEERSEGRAGARRIIVAPRSIVRPIIVAPYRPFDRPYYSFRPRTSFSLGVWIGYPVRYPSYA